LEQKGFARLRLSTYTGAVYVESI